MKPVSVIFSLTMVFIAVLPVPAWTLPVTGLYSHEVVVGNQSEQERNLAFQESLAAVIVKVTGEPRWLENTIIQQALENAQNYVEAIEYRSESVPVETADTALDGTDSGLSSDVEPAATPLSPALVVEELLNVSFAKGLVDQLLADAAIPVWDSNRPSVLVWMAVQNDAGERSLLSSESNPGIIQLIQQFAELRGIPIIFPVLDFEDRRTISADSIWALDEQAIRVASERYAPDSILAGRLLITASGDLVGLWQFIFQDQLEVFDSLDTELASYIGDPLDRVTTQLARHFAVAPARSGSEMARLRIEGIDNLAAYADLVNYLQELV
ncbi:MAG: DUF2066 domain-containing protein, partial [Gammaproteobacteria bacterium]|nr:DUF2066 domain-containing protein [Gammaproteobacteria bacterium]